MIGTVIIRCNETFNYSAKKDSIVDVFCVGVAERQQGAPILFSQDCKMTTNCSTLPDPALPALDTAVYLT